MEDHCYFVNSRGLLKSCDFRSPDPKSTYMYDTDYLKQMLQGNNMFHGMSIYVCTDVLPHFLNNILPNIKHYFYLVSGDSDARVPEGMIDIWSNPYPLKESICNVIMEHPLLIKWFAQNCLFTPARTEGQDPKEHYVCALANEKIFALPIGLDYHTISGNPGKFWRAEHEGNLPKHQESILNGIRQDMKPFSQRIPKIFARMHVGNNEGCPRFQALSVIPPELIALDNELQPRSQMWKKMAEYSFVLSPYGNAPECHRTWEALALGCIPIILSSGSSRMYQDLPVLIVNSWGEVTQELLDTTLAQFSIRKFHYEKLSLQYWVNLFT